MLESLVRVQPLFFVGSVDLLDRTGELMNLSERNNSMEPLSTLLKERQCYILICVSRGFVLKLLNTFLCPAAKRCFKALF